MADKLSDQEVYERMASALTAIGEEDGQTQFGNALMNAARDAMAVFKATGQEHLKNIKQRET